MDLSDDTPPETSRMVDHEAPVPARGDLLAGKYLVRSVLGSGGMGIVLDVEHVALGKRFALKLLRPGRGSDPIAIARFEHEARTIAALGHANICDIYDFGMLDDGRPFLVLERLDGESLASRLAREKRLRPARALSLLLQVLSALEAAHERGIVHRDVKPPNVFVTRGGGRTEIAKLLDFGVAADIVRSESLALTDSGVVLGTPAYMAPEQARGEASTDPRIDLYACGVMLYEMLCGERPFAGDNYNQTIVAILEGAFVPLSQRSPQTPAALDEIVTRALAYDPKERFQTAIEFQQAILRSGFVPMRIDALPPPASMSGSLVEEQAHTFRQLAAAFAKFSNELDEAHEDHHVSREEVMRLRQDLAELEKWTRQMRVLLARVAFEQRTDRDEWDVHTEKGPAPS